MNKFILAIFFIVIIASASCIRQPVSGFLTADKNVGTSGVLLMGSRIDGGTLSGWLDSETGEVYSTPSMELLYGRLTDASYAEHTGLTENGLEHILIKTDAADEDVNENLSGALADAEKKYYEHCSTCHSAPIIKRFYAPQLNAVMKSMIQHSNINDKDASDIRRYVSIMLNE